MTPKRTLTEDQFRRSNNDAIQSYLDESRDRMVTAAREDRKKRDEKAAKKAAEKALQPQH